MAIVVGIDEAGYGPLLGPLVVTGVALEVPDDHAERCLWALLGRSVSRTAARRDARLPILDSKKLYSRKGGLQAVERTALTAIQAWGHEPASLRDLLALAAPAALDPLNAYPWYQDFDVDLPVANDAVAIRMQAGALSRDCSANSVRLFDVHCESLPAGHFNRMVKNTRNKGEVLLGLALRIVDRFVRQASGRPLRIYVDRHGGRKRYGPHLLTAFEGSNLQIVEESAERSAYVLRGTTTDFRVEFATSGEERHLPVALASILSKYVRELFMIGLNRYWQRQVQGLRPTAGYHTDGRRFLSDIAPALKETSLDPDLLIRVR